MASVIVLLLSSDFAAEDSCMSIEMSLAVERHKTGEISVLPVLLRPTDDWQARPLDSSACYRAMGYQS